MNDIAKKATADKFLNALEKENLSRAKAGELIGLTPPQVSYLFNESYWDRLGNKYWEMVLAWVNSGYSLVEYPKHKIIIPPEKIASISEQPPAEDEITDPVFEEMDEISKTFDEQNKLPDTRLSITNAFHNFIKNNATMVITKTDKHYYFMPFWFLDTNKDQWELHNLGNLPEDLKEAIKSLRGE